MPKNRKKTYSDHQREAPRRKSAKKKPAPKQDVNQLAARIVNKATEH